MKVIATLKFDLPEDQAEFDAAMKSEESISMIREMAAWIRQIDKYEDRTVIPIDELKKKFYELLEEQELDFLI